MVYIVLWSQLCSEKNSTEFYFENKEIYGTMIKVDIQLRLSSKRVFTILHAIANWCLLLLRRI